MRGRRWRSILRRIWDILEGMEEDEMGEVLGWLQNRKK